MIVSKKCSGLFGFVWLVVCVCLSPASSQAESPTVARIDGPRGAIEITQERLVRYAETRSGVAVEQLLDELIEFELLAAEAAALGLHNTDESEKAADAAKVRLFLGYDFVEQWKAETLPPKLIRSSYDRNIRHFKRPELRDVDHIIVTIDGKRPTDPAVDADARQLADKIYEAVVSAKPQNREAFVALAADFANEAKSKGVQVAGENLGLFSKRGKFAPEFADTVFEYSTSKSILKPFVTQFGYHIVWLEKKVPALDRAFEEVEGEIRERVVPEVRQMKLVELTNRLAQTFPPISTHPGVAGLLNLEPLQLLDMRKGLTPVPGAPAPAPDSPAQRGM